MRLLFAFVCMLLLGPLSSPSLAQTPAPALFSPPDGSFQIALPGPVKNGQEGPPTWSWLGGRNPLFWVGYYQVPPDEMAKGQTLFDGFVKMVLEGNHILETRRAAFNQGDRAGYNIEGSYRQAYPAHVQVIVVGAQSRFYFLITIGDTDSAAYFNSLKLPAKK